MKKTQVALAALALVASSAALATEVKLSGQIDIGVFHTGKDNDGKGGVFMEQGGLFDHSSIQIDVKEDLGNGLKAFAVLESGFNANGGVDNGGTNGNANGLFNRQSFVGLSSDSLGTIGLGKQLSPFILSQALTNFGVGSFWVNRLAVGNAGSAGSFSAGGNGLNAAGFFIPNAITYTSPSIAGFTVRALTATKTGTDNNILQPNDIVAATDTDNRQSSVSIDGNIAGAFVSAAWQSRKDTYSGYTIGAVYPVMEGLSISANYMNDKNKIDDVTVKSWALGAKYTLVQGTDVILQYAQNNGNNSDALKKKLVNLTLTHSLSKRTTLYATAANGKQQGSALGNFKSDMEDKNNTSYGVGIAHTF